MMKNIFKLLFSLIVIIFMILKSLNFYENYKYKKNGNLLIEKVESFKKEHNRLPANLYELNVSLEMGEGPYYKKENDSTYIIYYNIGFDNSLVYSSFTRKWIEKP